MATISFLVNGVAVEQQTKPIAWVTIEEMTNGSLFFKVKQVGGSIENLHGVYFDIVDESIINSLRVTAVSSEISVSEKVVSCLKNGTDASEVLVSSKSRSADQHDINSYSFTFALHSTARALNLSDFPQIQLDYSGNGGDANATTNDDFSHRWLYLGLF